MAPTSCFNGQVNRLPDAPEAYGAMITRAKAAPGQSRYADLTCFDYNYLSGEESSSSEVGSSLASSPPSSATESES